MKRSSAVYHDSQPAHCALLVLYFIYAISWQIFQLNEFSLGFFFIVENIRKNSFHIELTSELAPDISKSRTFETESPRFLIKSMK